MVNQVFIIEWLRLAEMDYSSACFLLNHYPIPSEIICFHSQQSAEKILKCFLVLHDIEPPKIHNLLDLYQKCIPFDISLENIVQKLAYLNQYSVMPRYPYEIEITEDDSKTALKYAKDVLDFFRPHFSEYGQLGV
jgi:HEPN domain-containing protein